MLKGKSVRREIRVHRSKDSDGKSVTRSGRTTKERIHKLLTEIESRLEADSSKASVADYIRLLQLERELEEEDEAPREIRVTWVDPGTSPSET